MNHSMMTISRAQKIWNDCYLSDKWDSYSSEERLWAISVLQGNNSQGQWGIWNISDRD